MAGAQALRRALGLLRIIGDHPARRLSLSDLVELSGLERTTVHRLLTALSEERFLFRAPENRSYHLGVELLALGLRSLEDASYVKHLQPVVRRVALECREAAFLTIREGDYCYCVQREDPSPDFRKPLWTHTGQRLLLSASGAGLAMLASRSDAEAAAYMRTRQADLRRAKLTSAKLMRAIRAARTRGYSILSEVNPDGSSVGVAFQIGASIQAGISVGGFAGPPDDRRHAHWARTIRRELALSSPESALGG
jgi:DNA-binding IclR family transcriptional regulator